MTLRDKVRSREIRKALNVFEPGTRTKIETFDWIEHIIFDSK